MRKEPFGLVLISADGSFPLSNNREYKFYATDYR
jgi:hypothetical protein